MKIPSRRQQIATALQISITQVSRAFAETNRKPSKVILHITTVKAAESTYRRAPRGTTIKGEALNKWIRLCPDTRYLHSMWSEAESRNHLVGEWRDNFIKKWIEVSENLKSLGILTSLFQDLTDSELAPAVKKADEIIAAEKFAKKK